MSLQPKSQYGMIFFTIWNMRKQNLITEDVRGALKDMIIQHHPIIDDLLEFIEGNKLEAISLESKIFQMINTIEQLQSKPIDSDCQSEESHSIRSVRTQSKFKNKRPHLEIKNSNFQLVQRHQKKALSHCHSTKSQQRTCDDISFPSSRKPVNQG